MKKCKIRINAHSSYSEKPIQQMQLPAQQMQQPIQRYIKRWVDTKNIAVTVLSYEVYLAHKHPFNSDAIDLKTKVKLNFFSKGRERSQALKHIQILEMIS